jgi:hypothetical protein
MNGAVLWTGQWITKLLDFLFWIRLRAASRGCRNLLRTSEREGAAGTEPRIRTVRQLTAAAGDGLLGSVGSPGQLETSLNSGYQWAPATHTWRGPHPFIVAWLLAQIALYGRLRRRRSPRKGASAHFSSARRRAIMPTLAAYGPLPLRPAPRDYADARSHVASRSPTGGTRFATPAASGTSSSRQRSAQRGSARCCRRDRGSG